MSSRKRGRGAQVELNTGIKEMIVPVLILLVFSIISILTAVNAVSSLMEKDSGSLGIDSERDIWAQAETLKVGVNFKPIHTTEKEYEVLRAKCNEFLEQNSEAEDVDASIEVNTPVSEQRFVDENSTAIEGSTEQSYSSEQYMSETGPIYFQDMLMIRYINTEGQLKVITAMVDDSSEEIIVSRQDKLDVLVNKGAETEAVLEYNPSGGVSEEVYLEGVSNTLIKMLLASTVEEMREAESAAMNYFTSDGKQTVFGNRKDIKLLSGNSSAETVVLLAGKSEPTNGYKDRIYTQIKIRINDEEFKTNIILKLNSNFRIYDIDIV